MTIKVCFIILGLHFSGAENVLVQYLKGNEKLEPYFVFVFSGKAKKQFAKEFGESKCFEMKMSYHKNELRFIPRLAQWRIAPKLKEILSSIEPDLIYTNNTLESMLCGNLVTKINIPAFAHIHDMKNAYGTFIKVIETNKALKNYTRVFTVSEACKHSWNNENMDVVYNGIPQYYYTIEKNNAKKDGFCIGYVGMISRRKGADMLVKLVREIKEVNWHIAYNLIQDGFEDQIEYLKTQSNVMTSMNVLPENMPSFFDGLDMLIIPSRQDPLPTVAIEAMARHKLVVGFNVGGISELIGNNELIVDGISEKVLKDKIYEIISWSQEKRFLMQENLYIKAKEKFSQEKKRQIINQAIEAVVQNSVSEVSNTNQGDRC